MSGWIERCCFVLFCFCCVSMDLCAKIPVAKDKKLD